MCAPCRAWGRRFSFLISSRRCWHPSCRSVPPQYHHLLSLFASHLHRPPRPGQNRHVQSGAKYVKYGVICFSKKIKNGLDIKHAFASATAQAFLPSSAFSLALESDSLLFARLVRRALLKIMAMVALLIRMPTRFRRKKYWCSTELATTLTRNKTATIPSPNHIG